MISSPRQIPNNVDLSGNKRLQRALEHWQPNYLEWWKDMGPQGFQEYHQVYLRTAISVDPDGWAHFDYVKLPDYRWGIFLADPIHDRTIGFGDFFGQPVWQEVPGEFRNQLRRLIVTQGDTEPASVEQQRLLGQRCPSLYDLRNLFQVNVEEGRHLWAMVYLLHSYFGRDGRDEAEELLERQSGNRDKPRILEAFNEPIDNWLDFFMFTMFTDRDGKSQLMSLSESSLDPLARTTRFMLTEEAHHMFVGETGIARILERTCQLMKQAGLLGGRAQGRRHRPPDDPEAPEPVVQPQPRPARQRGLEQRRRPTSPTASRAAPRKTPSTSTSCKNAYYNMEFFEDGKAVTKEVPMRNAMNEVLRDWYVGDCAAGVDRWNRILESHGMSDRLRLPDRKFHRGIGMYSGFHFDPERRPAQRGGVGARASTSGCRRAADTEYLLSIMDEAGVRAGQVRELHRAAAARHQPAADRFRVRRGRNGKIGSEERQSTRSIGYTPVLFLRLYFGTLIRPSHRLLLFSSQEYPSFPSRASA